MRRTLVILAASTLTLGALSLVGCKGAGAHQVANRSENHAVGCKLCYDEAHAVVQAHAKGAQWSRTQVIKKHMCPDCSAEVTTYTQDGTPMIKCGRCAPEGVACDKCSPPP